MEPSDIQNTLTIHAQQLEWSVPYQASVNDRLFDWEIVPPLANCVTSVRWLLYNTLCKNQKKIVLPFARVWSLPKHILNTFPEAYIDTSSLLQAGDVLFFKHHKFKKQKISHVWIAINENDIFHMRRTSNWTIQRIEDILIDYCLPDEETLRTNSDTRASK